MRKFIFIIFFLSTISIYADILDDSIKFWYINKDYKKTKTYIYWSKKINNADENYNIYKKQNPYRAAAIESLLETGTIVVNIIGVFEVGAANSVLYVVKNYNSLTIAPKKLIYPI